MSYSVSPGWVIASTGLSTAAQEIVLYAPELSSGEPLDTLILAMFHGDEAESRILAQAFLQRYPAQQFLPRRVGIVPVVNPDGGSNQQRVNARGVDLNRNFPTQDWVVQNEDTPYYSGSAAASEAETQFVLDILSAHQPGRIIALHTPYRVINYDGPAKPLADAMAAVNGYAVVEDIGYATPGSFGTYTGKERQIPTITLELPENEAFTPQELENNLAALHAAILY